MKHFPMPRVEASFANHEAWVAAQVRDLFRTIAAGDATGVNACLDRIESYLENWLFLLLLETDQRWRAGVWWIDGFSTMRAEVILPSKLHMRGHAYMELAYPHEYDPPPPQEGKFECALYEPFDFELELSPTTGVIARYCFQFGDDRPLPEKRLHKPARDELPANQRWSFTFYGHCTEAKWNVQRSGCEDYTIVGSPYEDWDENDDDPRAATIASFARETAISARLVMRAEMAKDSEAYEICMLHLRHFLQASLSYHLRVDPDWDWRSGKKRIKRLGEALPDTRTPNRLILQDEAVVVRSELGPCREPVIFNIEVDPQTGEMSRYTYRFGKQQTADATASDQWQFVFHWAPDFERHLRLGGA
jgi:hypothetical protein